MNNNELVDTIEKARAEIQAYAKPGNEFSKSASDLALAALNRGFGLGFIEGTKHAAKIQSFVFEKMGVK